MASATILIVDDEPDIRETIQDILSDEGYEVHSACDAPQAREARIQHDPDLVLLDVWMPGMDGISLLREWTESETLECPVVMISGHGTVETAVEATRLGAWDFIEKPISMAKLLVTVKNALDTGRLRRENEGLRQHLPPVLEPVGRSPMVQNLRRQLEKVAAHEAPVLILGEPGVGKEQVARWIHANGDRASGPFVTASTRMSDADLRTLLAGSESEDGLLATAQTGVLFIDDLARMGPESQKWLLSVLESGRILPTRATSPTLDVRLLCGASQSLEKLVRAGSFEEALCYKVNVLPLQVPTLRERMEDIPELVRFYAEYFPSRDQVPYRPFSVAAQNRLRNYEWPGNLRELRNLIQRLLVLGRSDEISLEEVDQVLASSPASAPGLSGTDGGGLYNLPLREAREAFEKDYLIHQLKRVEGSVGKLADVVGMERTHLYRKLRQMEIDPKAVARGESS